MLATLVLLTAFSAVEPAYPVLVVTAHGASQTQAQIERAASVERARAEHVERLRAAAEITRARLEMRAVVRAHAKPSRPAADAQVVRLGESLEHRG